MARSSLLPAPARVEYPSSDGQPIAETDHQRTPLTYAVDALRCHFQDRRDVYVSGNLFIYYREGDPQAVVAPDVFVVMGAHSADRSIYRLWEEPKGPDFVLEITVAQHAPRRPGEQAGAVPLSRRARVLAARSDRRLPGAAAAGAGSGGGGVPAAALAGHATLLADGTRQAASAVLGLELRLNQRGLRFRDPRSGRDLPNLGRRSTGAADRRVTPCEGRSARGRARGPVAPGRPQRWRGGRGGRSAAGRGARRPLIGVSRRRPPPSEAPRPGPDSPSGRRPPIYRAWRCASIMQGRA